MTRSGDFRNANVTGALFDLINNKNTYKVAGEFKMSHLNLQTDDKTGFSSALEIAKISDQYQLSLRHDYADKKYDINDLGLLLRNNFNNSTAELLIVFLSQPQTFKLIDSPFHLSINSWLPLTPILS